MVRFFSYILLFTFAFQISGKLVICINYELNKGYIAKNLCENRSKPKMHCDGKCQLKKQLEKEDKQEDSSKFGLKEKSEWQINSFSKERNLSNNYVTGTINYSPHKIQKIKLISTSIFHPPSC